MICQNHLRVWVSSIVIGTLTTPATIVTFILVSLFSDFKRPSLVMAGSSCPQFLEQKRLRKTAKILKPNLT
jgi:hypothetical protein